MKRGLIISIFTSFFTLNLLHIMYWNLHFHNALDFSIFEPITYNVLKRWSVVSCSSRWTFEPITYNVLKLFKMNGTKFFKLLNLLHIMYWNLPIIAPKNLIALLNLLHIMYWNQAKRHPRTQSELLNLLHIMYWNNNGIAKRHFGAFEPITYNVLKLYTLLLQLLNI